MTNRGIRATMSKKKRKERGQEYVEEPVKKGLFGRKKSQKPDDKDKLARIRDFPLFVGIKPRKGFTFHSDYFKVDDTYAMVLTVLHHKGSDDGLRAFWGIDLIPRNLGSDISVRRMEHVSRVSESWVSQHQGRAEGLMKNRESEVKQDGSLSSMQRLNKEQGQLLTIARELVEGSSYLRVAFRLLVKAPTLERLDEAVEKINRQYKDQFDTVYATPYVGEQKRELSNLFNKIDVKMGRNFMFTSKEFAGAYSLVTRGIEDDTGEYIGQMQGDVNNSAVLMDLDDYESHVIIAGNAIARTLSYNGTDFLNREHMNNIRLKAPRGVDVWGAKLGMAALLRNKRVVHLVLNRARVDAIGINLDDVTSRVDMTRGDINPFEMFGRVGVDDEISIFSAHVQKIQLMIDQLYPLGDGDKSLAEIIKGELSKVINDFYVDKRMWQRNAQERRDALRIIGIPHNQVPRLPEFQAYLDMGYTAERNARAGDGDMLRAYNYLRKVFKDMMDTNGDLFDTTTSDIIDDAKVSNRVVYDFSSLLDRSRGVMMAQFVNALSFAIGTLREGDVVILHGAEQLADDIKGYVKDSFAQLHDRGVRTVMIYSTKDAIEKMILDRELNGFEQADYTLLGGMTKYVIDLYESTLRQEVPISLKGLLEHKERERYYLRRRFDNIVFSCDIQMGLGVPEFSEELDFEAEEDEEFTDEVGTF